MSAAPSGHRNGAPAGGPGPALPGGLWTWLRQDPAIRILPRWLPIAAFNTTLMLGVVMAAGRSEQQTFLSEPFWIFAAWATCFWTAVAIFLCSPGFRERCSPFALTMPVSPRVLWLLHLAAVILSGAAVLATAGALVAAIGSLRGLIPERAPLFDPDVTRLVVHLTTGLVFAATLLQSRRPGLHKIPADRRFVAFLAATIVGVLVLVVMLGERPIWVGVVPLAVAIAIGARTYRALPSAFALVPREAAVSDRGAEIAGEGGNIEAWLGTAEMSRPAGSPRPWLLYSTIYQCLAKKPWGMLLAVPFLIFFGMILGGGILDETEDLRYSHIVMGAYILFAFTAPLMGRVVQLDHMPISRRRLFSLITIPALALLCLGYGGGGLLAAWKSERKELIEYRKEDCCHYLYVPIEACRIAWDGRPPDNGSPWGETHAAWKVPLYRGSRAVLYSPYSTPADASIEFVAHQISRATEAVYGRRVPAEEIIDRYLETDESGRVSAVAAGLTLRRDHPDLKPRFAAPEFPLLIVVSSGLWLLLLVIYLRTLRASISDATRKVVYVGILVLILGAHISQFILAMAGHVKLWVMAGFMQVMIRALAESLPGGSVTIWIASLAAFTVAYLAAESRFGRMEAITGPWCGA